MIYHGVLEQCDDAEVVEQRRQEKSGSFFRSAMDETAQLSHVSHPTAMTMFELSPGRGGSEVWPFAATLHMWWSP